MGMEADDEGDSEKHKPDGEEPDVDPQELEILQGIVDKALSQNSPFVSKSGDKQGPAHLDGSASSDLSVKDLDAKGVRNKKKGMTSTKVVPNWASGVRRT